jgi:hypothetical protein
MQGDPFGCPIDSRTGYPRERSIDMILLCDPSMTMDDATPVSFIEVKPTGLGTCQYAFTLKTGAACGVQGDPFDFQPAVTGAGAPASNFGFTVLGAVLLVGFQMGFARLAAGGHLTGLTSRLPSFLGGGGGGGAAAGAKGAGFAKMGTSSGGAAMASSSSYGSYGSA